MNPFSDRNTLKSDKRCDNQGPKLICHTTMPTLRKRGKNWQAQVRVKEGNIIVFQESSTHPTKGAAEYWGLTLEREVARDGWKVRQADTHTVCAVLEMYAKLKSKIKPLGRGFEHSLNAVAYSPLGKLTLKGLSSAAIVAWAMALHDKGNAPATVMHHLAVLSAAFNASEAAFGIKAPVDVVAVAIKQLKMLRVAAASTKRERRLTDEELDKICASLMRTKAVVPTWDFVRLAVALPRRREELLSMKWDGISADKSTLKLLDTKDPRKYRDEVIPLPPQALAIINKLPRLDARVLPFKPESISAAFQRAVRRTGVLDARLHDLRHEGICRLFESGLAIEEVALISGHTSWATLKRYTHLRPEKVTEKMNASRQRQTKTADEPERPGKNPGTRARRSPSHHEGQPDRLSPAHQ